MPRVNVLGVGVSALAMEDALDLSEALIQAGGKGYVCVTGVHGVMEAQSNPGLRAILNRAYLNVPDGMPTVWVGRLEGHRRMGRVYGPSYMLQMCERSVSSGYRHFFYGGKPGVVERLAAELTARFPGLQVAGMYTPPFRALTPAEEDELAAQVRATRPDIVWVGLSTPKQEWFMAQYLGRLETKLLVGVGAAFDIHTGGIRDAPAWMKAAGLQWLHRLVQEPRRLWRRYLVNNPKFLFGIALQLLRIRICLIDS